MSKLITRLLAGLIIIALSQTTKATQSVEKDKINRKIDYIYYEAIKLKLAGKADAAYDLFSHALSIDSTAADVMYELAPYYLMQGDSEKALNLMQNAADIQKDNFEYQFKLASIHRTVGNFNQSAAIFSELAKKYPEKINLYYYLAESLTQQGDIINAIEAYNSMEKTVGINEGLTMEKFKLYKQISKTQEAFQELEKMAKHFHFSAYHQILVGDQYMQAANTDLAYKYYQQANKLEPNNTEYNIAMANYFQAVGNTSKAEEQILDIINDPTIEATTKAEIAMHYAKTLTDNQRTEEAKSVYNKIIETMPLHKEAWKQLIILLSQEEKHKEALELNIKATEKFKDDAELYFYLGICYYTTNDYKKALKTYVEGEKIIPPGSDYMRSVFFGQIGDIYHQLEQMEKAYEAYDKALQYNENNVAVLNNYSYFLSLEKKQLTKAERMIARCIKIEPDNATYLDTYAWIFFVQGKYTLAKMYINSAISKDTTGSSELVNHYGDILYMNGEKEEALEQWKKAKEMGHESETLDKKIEQEKYIEE